MGTPSTRSICLPSLCTTSEVHQLETRSRGGSIRRFLPGLEQSARICLPAICSRRSLSSTGLSSGSPGSSSYSTCLENSGVVSTITRPVCSITPIVTEISRPPVHARENLPSVQPKADWLVSANPTQRQEFQNQLKICFLPPGGKALQMFTRQVGENGLAGVLKGKVTPFKQISLPYWNLWLLNLRMGKLTEPSMFIGQLYP